LIELFFCSTLQTNPIIFYAVKMFSPGHKASQRGGAEKKGEGRESQARGEALRLRHALF
jgi:hypothetical protein